RRAMGGSETGGVAMTVFAAAVTGPLVECTSLPAAGVVAVLIAVVPLAMLAWTKVAHCRLGASEGAPACPVLWFIPSSGNRPFCDGQHIGRDEPCLVWTNRTT